MKCRIARMSSLVLAFGIFFSISCGNLKSTESADEVDKTTLQDELNELNRQISENPDNSNLQIDKATLLYRYSKSIPAVANRKPIYQNLRDLADNFTARFGTDSDPINNILEKAWHEEQAGGIKLLHQNNPSEISDQEVPRVISHFDNAITIMPDSLQTYSLLATTYYREGNLEQAIGTLVSANERGEDSNTDIEEKLAYLHLESGNLEEAERRYRDLAASHPDNLLYKHGFVNVLILSDKHEEAAELLEELSDDYPNRYNYQESLATELYYLFRNQTSQYIEEGNSESLSENDRQEISNMLNSIHTIFESLQETLPSSEENLYRMAAFYKKASMRLEELSANNDQVSFSDLQDEFMGYSLPLWERLVELQPDNIGYISNLHEVYVALEMHEEAEALERSYNF